MQFGDDPLGRAYADDRGKNLKILRQLLLDDLHRVVQACNGLPFIEAWRNPDLQRAMYRVQLIGVDGERIVREYLNQ